MRLYEHRANEIEVNDRTAFLLLCQQTTNGVFARSSRAG